MLHNAPSLDLSSIILFWKKSRKIDHVSWIDTELIWNLIFPNWYMYRYFIKSSGVMNFCRSNVPTWINEVRLNMLVAYLAGLVAAGSGWRAPGRTRSDLNTFSYFSQTFLICFKLDIFNLNYNQFFKEVATNINNICTSLINHFAKFNLVLIINA